MCRSQCSCHVCAYVRVYACMCTCACVCARACLCVCVCVRVCARMCVYMCLTCRSPRAVHLHLPASGRKQDPTARCAVDTVQHPTCSCYTTAHLVDGVCCWVLPPLTQQCAVGSCFRSEVLLPLRGSCFRSERVLLPLRDPTAHSIDHSYHTFRCLSLSFSPLPLSLSYSLLHAFSLSHSVITPRVCPYTASVTFTSSAEEEQG